MQLRQASFISLLAWLTAVKALVITEPTEDTVINPEQPFTIKWTSTSGDPQTLTFTLTGADDFSILQYRELATNVQASAGSVNVPANTVGAYGQYKIQARDASTSTVVTTSPEFYLAQGNGQTQSITSNVGAHGDSGLTSTITQATANPSSGAGNSQVSVITNENGTSIILSGTREPTTTASRTSVSGSVGSSTTSASTSSTSNAQIRIGGDGNSVVLGAAGLIAGMVALIV